MQKSFASAFGKAYRQSYGYDDEVSPNTILDENFDAITDLLGNVIEGEF